jgi:PBSX family phage terminase large subunit
MLLHLNQKTIARDRSRFRVVCSGRRFGKTVLAVEEILGKAVFKADQNVVYIAPTYQQARDIAWELLKKRCQPIANQINESRLEISINTVSGGTSKIFLRGWESVETLRGQRFDFIVIDEIAMMRNFWVNWQEVLRPTLTDTKGEVLFISTPKGFNHFYDLYNLEAKDTDFKSFHFTSYDNPFIPAEEIDKAKQQITEDRFAQEYMADFRRTEGLVYKEFNRSFHLKKTDATPKEVILGIDFGYTNPAAIVRILVDSDNGYWVTDEWYKTGQTNENIIQAASLFKANRAYPDPAEPDRIAELIRGGVNCLETSKDVEAGIDRVKELFKQNRLHIADTCVNLVWELETYRYPDKTSDLNFKETPIKENDHCLDALRYALYNHSITGAVVNNFSNFKSPFR